MSKDIFEKAKNKPKKPWYMVNTKKLPDSHLAVTACPFCDWH